jgi:hypothetical protein
MSSIKNIFTPPSVSNEKMATARAGSNNECNGQVAHRNEETMRGVKMISGQPAYVQNRLPAASRAGATPREK